MTVPSTKPLILVTADAITYRRYEWHAAIGFYCEAVTDICGAVPVIVPALGDRMHIATLLDHADGVLATGSRSNVYPGEYGRPEDETAEPYDRARDATALPLMRQAVERSVPVLAICRGLQEMNVAWGGTLFTEVHNQPARNDHRGSDDPDNDIRFQIKHGVDLAPDSRLAGIMGAETIQVNSVHRQAIDRLAADLEVEATAEDGTVEAIRVRDAPAFALGVQWHPEYWARTDTPSRMIFEAFGDAARAHLQERAGRSCAAEQPVVAKAK